MPDFEVNEGYVEAGRRRADSPLPSLRADGRVSPDGRDAVSGDAIGQDADAAETDVERHKLPEETPIVRRTRHLAEGHLAASGAVPERRVGVKLIARRRRLARRACPYGWHVHVLGTPLRHRRRLWTQCHGQPLESPS